MKGEVKFVGHMNGMRIFEYHGFMVGVNREPRRYDNYLAYRVLLINPPMGEKVIVVKNQIKYKRIRDHGFNRRIAVRIALEKFVDLH